MLRRQTHNGRFLLVFVNILFCAATVCAQTTSFTYQGRLTDGGNPASGNYDLQFTLFDSSAAGAQIGSTQAVPNVAVTGGVFTVQLDFGVSAFPGANRFLEIDVKPSGGGNFTMLSPRQQISSTPYAIRTLSATIADALSSACSGCVQDSQINSVAGSKVSGTIPTASLPADSGSYIQNTPTPQASSNFNISGNGSVGGTLSASNAGIGTTSPLTRLHVVSSSGDGAPRLQSPVTNGFAAGLDFYHGSTPRGYVGVPDPAANLAPGELILFGGSGTRTSFWANGNRTMTLDGNGNVGVGTNAPAARLHVAADGGTGVYGTSTSGTGVFGATNTGIAVYGKSTSFEGVRGEASDPNHGAVVAYHLGGGNAVFGSSGGTAVLGTTTATNTSTQSGVYGQSTGDGGIGVIGEANIGNSWGVYGKSASGTGVGVVGEANNGNGFGILGMSSSPTGVGILGRNRSGGPAMIADGNVAQNRDKSGWVKAMALIDSNGAILRCYNGITGISTGNCGFSVETLTVVAAYIVDFGFQVNDRFISVTPFKSVSEKSPPIW